MATYAELQAQVASAIIDTPTNVVNLIPTFLKRAMRDLQISHNFKVMEATTDVLITTESTRVLAAVPSTFKEFRKRPYLIDSTGSVIYLGYSTSREDVAREFGTDEGGEQDNDTIAGEPRVILRSEPTNEAGASNFEVWPLPDANSTYGNTSAGSYRIRIPYWKFLTELSGSTDTNWFTVNADQYLVEQAAAYGFFEDHDEDRGTLWTQRAASSKKMVIKRAKMEQFSAVETLRPNRDVFGSPISFGEGRL